MVCPWAYIDGRILPAKAARIPIFDRGLLFAQSAYEVTTVYAGKLVDGAAHMERLARSLSGLDLDMPMDADEFLALHTLIVQRNELREGGVYLQVTAGDYGERDFAGPEKFRPRIFIFAQARQLISPRAETGIAAITLPDERWRRRDLKTTQLLSQALAYRKARETGAGTAIFIENGHVTEAASANVWVVDKGGNLSTRALSPDILGGITRAAVKGLATIPVLERTVSEEELRAAREVFLTSAGGLVQPVITIDGAPVGRGKPGPVTRAMQRAFYAYIGADLQTVAPWALP